MKFFRILATLSLGSFLAFTLAHGAEAKTQQADKTPAEAKSATAKDKTADKDSCCDDEKKTDEKGGKPAAPAEVKK